MWLAALCGVGAYIARICPTLRPALVVGALLLLMGEMLARGRDLTLPQDRTLMLLLGVTIALWITVVLTPGYLVGRGIIIPFAIDQRSLAIALLALSLAIAIAIAGIAGVALRASKSPRASVPNHHPIHRHHHQ